MCESIRVSLLSRWDKKTKKQKNNKKNNNNNNNNDNEKKSNKKNKTKKQQQNNNKIKKKNKEKTANNNQKKGRKHHIFHRQIGRLTLAVLKCPTVCFGLSFQKHTVGHFLHSSESPKSETLTNLKGCQNRRHLKGALLDGIVEGDPTTPPAELHTPKAFH